MSIKTTKRLALGVIASLVFAPLAAIAPANAAVSAASITPAAATVDAAFGSGTSASASTNVVLAFTATVNTDAVAMTASVTGPAGATATPVFTVGAQAVAASALTNNDTTVTATATGAGNASSTNGLVLTVNRTGVYVVTITPDATGVAAGATAKTITFTFSALYAVTADGLASGTASKSTANAVAGPANTVTLAVAEQGTTPRLVTISGAGAKTTTATAGDLTVANDGLSIVVAAGTSQQVNNFVVQTPNVGTVTVSVFEQSAPGIFSATALNTVTITVNAAAITNVFSAAKSTALAGKTNVVSTTAAAETTALTTPVIASSTLSAVAVANVQVIQKDGTGTTGTNLTSGFKTVSATITGAGLLGTVDGTPTGASVTSSAAAITTVYVFPNGTSSVATLTVSVDGVVVKTLPISFYGAVASLTATSKISSVNADGGALAGVLEVVAKDANGILVPGATVTFDKAADATLVSTMTAAGDGDNDGDQLVGITPIAGKYGTTTVTVKSGTVISNPVTVVLAHNQIATATLALDAATYLPGVKGKLTMAAKDKNGLIVPDALTAATTLAFSSNLSTTTTFGTAPTFVAGAYAQDVFAPAITSISDWTISVKITANAIFATTLVPAAGATLTATAKVGIPPVVVPVVVPPVVYDNPTLSFVKDGGRIILSGTAVDGEGDIIIYTKRVGTTAWKERAKTLEVAAPGDFNGSIKALKNNVVIRVKQEGTGQFSNQIIVLK